MLSDATIGWFVKQFMGFSEFFDNSTVNRASRCFFVYASFLAIE